VNWGFYFPKDSISYEKSGFKERATLFIERKQGFEMTNLMKIKITIEVCQCPGIIQFKEKIQNKLSSFEVLRDEVWRLKIIFNIEKMEKFDVMDVTPP